VVKKKPLDLPRLKHSMSPGWGCSSNATVIGVIIPLECKRPEPVAMSSLISDSDTDEIEIADHHDYRCYGLSINPTGQINPTLIREYVKSSKLSAFQIFL